jgi:hypothetical protein
MVKPVYPLQLRCGGYNKIHASQEDPDFLTVVVSQDLNATFNNILVILGQLV